MIISFEFRASSQPSEKNGTKAHLVGVRYEAEANQWGRWEVNNRVILRNSCLITKHGKIRLKQLLISDWWSFTRAIQSIMQDNT